MRLRNIPGAKEYIAAAPHVVPEEQMWALKGAWHTYFENDRPIYMEIGTGKGRFITELAASDPTGNYIGIEKYSSVLIKAVRKVEAMPDLTNLVFLRMDAEYITQVFGPGEISGIYLNFSDPWPKDRHAGRRLPGERFLERYRLLLVPGGQVSFKTDNQDLFDYALEAAKQANYEILSCTRDLHHDPVLSQGNIMTEYEVKFSAMGNPICKLVITPRG